MRQSLISRRLPLRAMLVVGLSGSAVPGDLFAQRLDQSISGQRIRVELCDAGSASPRAGWHSGVLTWLDSGTIALSSRPQRNDISLTQVQRAEINTVRSRELHFVGTLVGVALGVVVGKFATNHTQRSDRNEYAGAGSFLLGVVVGGIVGNRVGAALSGHEVWKDLELPPGAGAVCPH